MFTRKNFNKQSLKLHHYEMGYSVVKIFLLASSTFASVPVLQMDVWLYWIQLIYKENGALTNLPFEYLCLRIQMKLDGSSCKGRF